MRFVDNLTAVVDYSDVFAMKCVLARHLLGMAPEFGIIPFSRFEANVI